MGIKMITDEQYIYKMMFKVAQKGVYANPVDIHIFKVDSKFKTGFLAPICLN
tara:strand:- start:48584 stop:48739 length:156 start_codon:yes stop_codon:yes gene_type:complete